MLDDVLGWTDDDRFRGMVRVLESAANDLQVILLTCHPMRFSRVPGARAFDFEKLAR